ncbi:unnamed protein product [Paramecium octaurelia]|uniref:Uncharacterized protein n=1 Tax=Paramecium octaurelia TaxID=43137 RepID=A0A8S1YCR1_PAROT|nr:unnamed protein product [Paramecium octaurelia]CAD8209244.1 unnamed protein product [Paramecium octaurelia]
MSKRKIQIEIKRKQFPQDLIAIKILANVIKLKSEDPIDAKKISSRISIVQAFNLEI